MGCNHSTKYVVMFISVRATVSWLRIISVVGAAISIIPLALIPLFAGFLWFGNRQTTARGVTTSPATLENGAALETSRSPRRNIISNFSDAPSRSYAAGLLASIYGIVMLELTVSRNNVEKGEAAWSFGQIFALLVTIGSINEVAHFIMSKEWPTGNPQGMFISYHD